jgi:DNA-directed RNA polymerase subunit RPC12/RpoP
MKLIQMKCPNCGASLEITTDNKEIICNYCRTPIILDEEIIKVEHTIQENTIKEKIKVANTYLNEFEDYEQAYKEYGKLTHEYPYEPEVWLGLVLCITKKFTEIKVGTDGEIFVELDLCDEYFNKYLKVEKDAIRKEKNKEEYGNYRQHLIKMSEQLGQEYKKESKEADKIAIIISFAIIGMFILMSLLFSQ